MTHVSTAYVNSDKKGKIHEKVYPEKRDSEEIIAEIMAMTEEQTLRDEKKIIGDYPNTYMFSKAMVERTLEKLKGHLKLAIVRPAIVVSAHDEPLNGWTETISAMGALLFAGMLGLINYM
jgi:alcohol-forming fatty acyl-CoA reductase